MSHLSVHFDVGNSNDGPVGFCARLCAKSPEQALRLLREEMPDKLIEEDSSLPGDESYFAAYFNPNKVTVDDIDVQTECNCSSYESDDESEKEG